MCWRQGKMMWPLLAIPFSEASPNSFLISPWPNWVVCPPRMSCILSFRLVSRAIYWCWIEGQLVLSLKLVKPTLRAHEGCSFTRYAKSFKDAGWKIQLFGMKNGCWFGNQHISAKSTLIKTQFLTSCVIVCFHISHPWSTSFYVCLIFNNDPINSSETSC